MYILVIFLTGMGEEMEMGGITTCAPCYYSKVSLTAPSRTWCVYTFFTTNTGDKKGTEGVDISTYFDVLAFFVSPTRE